MFQAYGLIALSSVPVMSSLEIQMTATSNDIAKICLARLRKASLRRVTAGGYTIIIDQRISSAAASSFNRIACPVDASAE